MSLFGNAELGGNKSMKYVSSAFLVTLWLLFVLAASLNAYGFLTNPLHGNLQNYNK